MSISGHPCLTKISLNRMPYPDQLSLKEPFGICLSNFAHDFIHLFIFSGTTCNCSPWSTGPSTPASFIPPAPFPSPAYPRPASRPASSAPSAASPADVLPALPHLPAPFPPHLPHLSSILQVHPRHHRHPCRFLCSGTQTV